MKEFNFYGTASKCSLTHVATEKKLTGIRAKIAFVLVAQIGEPVSIREISEATYSESTPDYYMIRSIDVHLTYVRRFFKDLGYESTRVRNEGITLIAKQNVV